MSSLSSVVEGEFLDFEYRDRWITVYLPKEYHLWPERVFPAVFLQDGDFLFKECINVIESNVRDELAEPVIFIGINSQHRNDEYTPWEMGALHSDWSFGGKGEQYLDVVYDELVPYMLNRFRISYEPKDLALGGVSLGGLISLYAMYRKEQIFGKFILISASVWFKDFLKYMETNELVCDPQVYMYVGMQEGATKTNVQRFMVPNSEVAYGMLKERIVDSEHRVKFESDPEGTHTDPYFLKYFPNGIQFLFGEPSSKNGEHSN